MNRVPPDAYDLIASSLQLPRSKKIIRESIGMVKIKKWMQAVQRIIGNWCPKWQSTVLDGFWCKMEEWRLNFRKNKVVLVSKWLDDFLLQLKKPKITDNGVLTSSCVPSNDQPVSNWYWLPIFEKDELELIPRSSSTEDHWSLWRNWKIKTMTDNIS